MTFKGTDHHYLMLQKFIRKCIEETYDSELSKYYGFQEPPKFLDWNNIKQKYFVILPWILY